MKIIHTSDWHLGQNFYGYDRSAEHTQFLQQLRELICREQPDALLVCGDVFDTMQPSAAAMRLYNDHLLALHDACPTMTIIVTAGNHDSPSRIEVDTNLWQRLNAHTLGDVSRDCNGLIEPARHIIPIIGKHKDKAVGYVVAVPFLRGIDYRLNGIQDMDEPTQHPQLKFVDHLLTHAHQLAGDQPVVLMMHTAIRSSNNPDKEERIGNIDYIALSDITGPRDYLALGHIHRPHTITGSDSRARYSGSPIAMSFDEDFVHSVSVVTLNGHETPIIDTIAINTELPLQTIPQLPIPYTDTIELLRNLPKDSRGYIRINIAAEHYLPGSVRETIAQILEDKQLKFCDIIKTPIHTHNQETGDQGLSLEEFRALPPLEVANRYFSHKGLILDEMHQQMLQQITTSQPSDDE